MPFVCFLPFIPLDFEPDSQGDWKIAGLGLTIPLMAQGGGPTRWEFPTFDGHVPAYIQRSFDYMGIPSSFPRCIVD